MNENPSSERPFVSIVIPVRNEEQYIGKVLESILAQSYPADRMEIVVVDGRSTDRTREVLQRYQQQHAFIRCIDNPDGYVPHAMNRGIRAAQGDVIVRIDAHAEYPKDYVQRLVEWLLRLKADNVGGVFVTLPGGQSDLSRAAALAMAHPFGVGNAQFRIVDSDDETPRLVDTVPYGCYPRSVFDRIGLYDEDLLRNQDEELNARIIQNGGKIYLIPAVKIYYYGSRRNLRSLARMFYQYGYFKPLVNMKLKRPASWRQFVPPAFVLALVLPLLGALLYRPLWGLSAAALLLHALVNAAVSFQIARTQKKWRLWPYLWTAFLTIHLAYGWGFLRGMVDFMLLKKHQKKRVDVALSR